MAMFTLFLMSACFCVLNLFLADCMDNTLLFVIDIVVWTLLNVWFDVRIRRKAPDGVGWG